MEVQTESRHPYGAYYKGVLITYDTMIGGFKFCVKNVHYTAQNTREAYKKVDILINGR